MRIGSTAILDGEDVTVTNVTDQRGIVALTGPRSRDVLETLTDAISTPRRSAG